jgi:hypothetical protein
MIEQETTYDMLQRHIGALGALNDQQIIEEKIKFLCLMIDNVCDSLVKSDRRNRELGIAAFNSRLPPFSR